jgi:hypothetical protein
MVLHSYTPSYSGGRGRRITARGWPVQEHETLSEKLTQAKRSGGVTQAIECCLARWKP